MRLGISGIWLNTAYNPQYQSLNEVLGPGAIQFTPIYFSAQYNAEKWTLTAEYAMRHFNYDKAFGDSIAARTLNGQDFFGESYYIQGEYRFTPKWEGFLRYDALFANRDDRNGKDFVEFVREQTTLERPAHSRFAKDITAGLRWNITPQFMLRGEYHYVNGTGWLSRLDNNDPNSTEQYWHFFAIQAAYRF